ncbi:MAG: hypothetical protein GC179_15880 [Anaerolineaceae bacterium]|nr:hypothetical protein [Anaerolineaceae bacterium]
MNYLYFACDWIISTAVIFGRTFRAAQQSGIQLVTIGGLKKNDEGFLFITFAMRVSEETQLEAFKQMIGIEKGFVNWYPISATFFAQGEEVQNPLEMGTEAGSQIDAMIRNVKHNRNLQEQISTANTENYYFGCDWVLLPNQPTLLPRAIEVMNKFGGEIHALWSRNDEQGYHIQELGVRVTSLHNLASFIIEIGQAIGWNNWHKLSEEYYYWGTSFTDDEFDFWNINFFVKTSQNAALKNQEIANNQKLL